MKRSKLLMPLIGITTLSTIALPLTSCGNNGNTGGETEITPTITVYGGSAKCSTIKLNNSFTITYTPNDNYELSDVTITIGGNKLNQGDDFIVNGNTITVNASAVTSTTIVITIKSKKATSGSTKVITSDTTLTSGSFKSTASDQNAVLVNGDDITANLSNLTLNKSGDCTNTDDSHFLGTNSALLAKGGSTVVLDTLNVTTNAKGANGVFAYGGESSTKESAVGDGTNITIKNSTINTSKDESGGVMVAGHGELTAENCTVTTSGDHSAPIRSDKGGDKMTITGGTYTSSGKGSPTIYSTATVKATNAKLTATHSSGVVVEGSNFVTLNNCDLEDTNDSLSGKSTTHKNIFLYQSTSGDAGSGKDGITINGGTMKTHYGDDFYVTNQTSEITLNGVDITNDYTDTKYFLRAQKDSWGKTDENGGHATLTATSQTINGNIYIDDISSLELNLTSSSAWTGALTTNVSSTQAAGEDWAMKVTIDSTSSWTLTADSYVGSIDATSLSKVAVNGHKLYGWNGTDWEVIKE